MLALVGLGYSRYTISSFIATHTVSTHLPITAVIVCSGFLSTLLSAAAAGAPDAQVSCFGHDFVSPPLISLLHIV